MPSPQNQGRSQHFAPGKVILLGEHAVVYGHTALAAPLTQGITAHAEPGKACRLELPRSLPPAGRKVLEAAFNSAARLCGKPAIVVRLESNLPVAVGLGSSAAVSVACARALMASRRRPPLRDIIRVAQEMERVFHGTPSGVDATCSALGQLIGFRRPRPGGDPKVKKIRSRRPLQLVVAVLGDRTPTRVTVAALRDRMEQWPARYQRLLAEIGRMTNDGIAAVEAGDLEALGDAMNVNHGLLSALQLSSPDIDSLVHKLRSLGALGAKLTGAGGRGGAVIGLFREKEAVLAGVLNRLTSEGLRCFTSDVTAGNDR